MNNFEKIKSMTVDEMAEWLDNQLSCSFCEKFLNKTCGHCEDFCYSKRPKRIKQWLLAEVEE